MFEDVKVELRKVNVRVLQLIEERTKDYISQDEFIEELEAIIEFKAKLEKYFE